MIYEHTQNNMLALMQHIGTLTEEQLTRFFSDAMSVPRIQNLLDKMVTYSYLKYDEALKRYTFHGFPEINKDIVDKRIRAFWVLANWGSNSILEVYTLPYPLQFFIITPDNFAFDITVCNSMNEAQIARHVWDANAVKGVPDDVNHIAVVPTAELGEKLRPYGFDSYCLIDPFTQETFYTSLEF